MFIDALMLLDPAATAITVTADSTNIWDVHLTTGLPATETWGRDMGIGDHVLDVRVMIQQTFTAGGAATLQTSLRGAPDAGSNAPGAFYDMIMTGVIPVANLLTGKTLMKAPLPAKCYPMDASEAAPRFYKMTYTVATGPMTAGTVETAIVDHNSEQSDRQYGAGFAVNN